MYVRHIYYNIARLVSEKIKFNDTICRILFMSTTTVSSIKEALSHGQNSFLYD